jgi:hypothetical protein
MNLKLVVFLGLSAAVSTGVVHAATNYVITSPDYIYAVNGAAPTNTPGFFTNNCPPLTLTAGNTYTFTMEATFLHPMVVGTNASTGLPLPVSFSYSNASPQEVFSGTITLTLPATNFPSKLYYQCNNHGFYGVITVVGPSSTPPPNNILGVSVTTNIVLISSGTSTSFKLVPQFSSNLISGVWRPVPNFTNTFANGTNTTVFDRLDPICGPNVFLRISQQPP